MPCDEGCWWEKIGNYTFSEPGSSTKLKNIYSECVVSFASMSQCAVRTASAHIEIESLILRPTWRDEHHRYDLIWSHVKLDGPKFPIGVQFD